jgi:hypothetical protein
MGQTRLLRANHWWATTNHVKVVVAYIDDERHVGTATETVTLPD